MDQWLLLFLKFVRMVAYGLTTMILVPFLLELGCTDSEVGLFMTLTLFGDVVLSSVITFGADKSGRRFMLGLSSVLMLLSGVCFVFCTRFWILLAAAVLGVISPSGDEVGPFRAIEEAAVAQITRFDTRSRLFALQNLVGTLGLALGSLGGGSLADIFAAKTGKRLDAYRVIFFGYVVCALASLFVAANLSDGVEVPGPDDGVARPASAREPLAEGSETGYGAVHGSGAVYGSGGIAPAASAGSGMPDNSPDENFAGRYDGDFENPNALSSMLCLLFGIDSLAYGFMSNSWLVEYMLRTFRSASTVVGAFFFVSTFISALTSFPSAWFTDYAGPVAAICLTKLGAGLFGALVPASPFMAGAMALVWLRSLFDTMDVVPRQMFITSIVPPADRTRVLGLVNVVKTLARAIGPLFTGWLASRGHLAWCFVIMGALEWTFAFAVYGSFRHALDTNGPIQI